MDSRLAGLEVAVDGDITGLKALQETVQEDTVDLLAKGQAARQVSLVVRPAEATDRERVGQRPG